MSRIGKKIITIPAGVDLKVAGKLLTVKGSKGELTQLLHEHVFLLIEDGNCRVKVKKEDDKFQRSLWGLFASLISNMIIGVTEGFSKKLEINGVGYKAAASGKVITLNLGFSHDIKYTLPDDISAQVEKNSIVISGVDKQKVGQVAAEIRAFKKPEPYLGKGIKYSDEYIRRKVGKTAKA